MGGPNSPSTLERKGAKRVAGRGGQQVAGARLGLTLEERRHVVEIDLVAGGDARRDGDAALEELGHDGLGLLELLRIG